MAYSIHVLFAQRLCYYEGEFDYECLGVMSEGEMSENPGYLESLRKKHLEGDEFVAAEIIEVKVDRSDIDDRLMPARKPVMGVIGESGAES
ncbi:hypothetical protein RM531_08150 [Salinisphaera sp. P385]|uniref:Uncharacterized protein n=1 Tax=Spectribacter acetivorans TaxID=3075603 RepID=A0ABU3B7K8_9GAMM|nr:hypothetical protein [Salinisphaera sp. P385]MDT0618446.1 hypothetical protein [Salinisphaera sp. P385]